MKKELINQIEELKTSIKEVKTYINILKKENTNELIKAKKLLINLENELIEIQNNL